MNQNAHNWHPADILAAVQKRGRDLASVARANGIAPRTASKALQEPCYSGEQVIAEFLGKAAHEIWPNRYDKAGIPLHPRIRKQFNAPCGTNTSQKMELV
ncbi:helix-turn-helix domain-containing protein [Ruegeria sp. ANG-R]|uniref:helix-turn-helix domain-containing protein n=1 Tax=Ruegeria sp. ANG-R TaxID=1577903 RepID=UPI0009E33D58|nr:helix-turn-helix domain-containing protein [Ruegeria sp. ANG-R]